MRQEMLRVLIIDDKSKSRKKVTNFLDSRGIKHDIAEVPQQAHQKMLTTNYALVFLDLDLGAGHQEGLGILTWMERNSKCFPTVITSESANLPDVIKAEASRGFVKLRLQQTQISALADLLDVIMIQGRGFSSQNLITRCLVAVFGVSLALAAAYAVMRLKGSFPNSDRTMDMAVVLVVFSVVCALVIIFGDSIVDSALELYKRIISASGSPDQISNEEEASEEQP